MLLSLRRVSFLPVLALLAAVSSALPRGSGQDPRPPRYVPVDLGALAGWEHVRTVAVNDRLQVTGTVLGESGLRAFLWLPRPAFGLPAGMSVLGTLALGESNGSSAGGIDNCGRIVGTATGNTPPAPTIQRAFLWQNGVMQDLGTLTGLGSGAAAINRRGLTVGWSSLDSRTLRGFTTRAACGETPSGAILDLGSLADTWSLASAVNDADQVVGSTALAVPPASITGAPFFYTARRGMIRLPFLPGMTSGDAAAINAHGAVVGACSSLRRNVLDESAALWRESRGTWSVTDLGRFDGLPRNAPTAIDGKDRVIGTAGNDFMTDTRGWIWIQGVYHALDDLLVTAEPIRITRTGGVNARGDIAASGIDARGELRGFLLVRVP